MGSNRFSGLKEITKPHGGVSLVDEAIEGELLRSTDDLIESRSEQSAFLSPSEMVFVPRSKIHRDPNQSRRYFDPEELQKMAESIKKVGVIDPYSVRRKPGSVDEYDLLAGERRDRAAEIAGLETVPVRIFSVDDSAAENIKDISNLQRVDLNAWEESWALMRMLMRNLGKSQSRVEKLLHQMANQQRGITQNKVTQEEWQIVEDVFAITGRISWDTFRKTRLKLLKLPTEVERVLRDGKLHHSKVDEILKVKDLEPQRQLLEESLRENLTVVEIKNRVKRYKSSRSTPAIATDFVHKDGRSKFQELSIRLREQDLWDDPAVVDLLDSFHELLRQKLRT